MAVDTFMAYVGVYSDVAHAEADYELVKDLHTQAGLVDAYDAAVVERRADGKVKIVKQHETPTRVGGVLGGGVGLATGVVVALFPFAAVEGGLLAATAGGGAVLGALLATPVAGILHVIGRDLYDGYRGRIKPEPTIGQEQVPMSSPDAPDRPDEASRPALDTPEQTSRRDQRSITRSS